MNGCDHDLDRDRDRDEDAFSWTACEWSVPFKCQWGTTRRWLIATPRGMCRMCIPLVQRKKKVWLRKLSRRYEIPFARALDYGK